MINQLEISKKVSTLENLVAETEAFQRQLFRDSHLRGYNQSRLSEFNTITLQMHRRYGHTSMISGFIKNKIMNKFVKNINILVIFPTHIMMCHFMQQLSQELPLNHKASIAHRIKSLHLEHKNIKIEASLTKNYDNLRGQNYDYIFVDNASLISKDEVDEIKEIVSPIANYRQEKGQTFVCAFLG